MKTRATSLRGGLLPQLVAGPLLAFVMVAAIEGGVISSVRSYDVALAAVYGIVVLSVSLLAGWGGVWSVGHPALFAIGAYTAAYGSAHGWALEVVVLVSIALAAVCGGFLGFAGARFSVLYISLLTLAFDLVVLEIIGRWQSVTGGDQGVPVATLESALGLGNYDSATGALNGAIIAFGVILVIAVLVRRSALRMRLVAVKSHPVASRSIGIAPELQTALAFAVSAAVTGFAGVIFAAMGGFVSPEPFSLIFAINLIAATVLGGVGSIAGAVVGGGFLALAPTLASSIGVSQQLLQGAILIAVLLFLPKGTVPSLQSLLRSVLRRWAPPPPATVPATPAASAAGYADGSVGRAGVEVEGLTVRFGGLTALEDVSLQVRPGEVLGIIGPNGAGKTTLINALSGLLSGGKLTGSVRYGDTDLLSKRPTERRHLGIARAFQHAELFSELTVAENVLSARRVASASARREVAELLHQVDLADVADRYPRELPFGLQKRADLARAVSGGASLILLDEPFGGLDEHEREILAAEIRNLNAAGATILIVDHVLDDLFAVADRVVAFDFGEPIAEGDSDTVLRDERVRASYLGADSDRVHRPPAPEESREILALRDVAHHYAGVHALRGVDLSIAAGTILGIVGANGAGKSTLGRIAVGVLRPSAGSVEVRPVNGRRPRRSLVPEGREIFKTLSIRENLEVAAYGAGLRGAELRARLEQTEQWLPERLRKRISASAGGLSGGEQQIVALARGIVSGADVLIVDEPALGLAPALVDEVYTRIADLAASGVTVIMLEQLLGRALTVCHEVVILHDGQIVAAGNPEDEQFTRDAEKAYFGDVSTVLMEEETGENAGTPHPAT